MGFHLPKYKASVLISASTPPNVSAELSRVWMVIRIESIKISFVFLVVSYKEKIGVYMYAEKRVIKIIIIIIKNKNQV